VDWLVDIDSLLELRTGLTLATGQHSRASKPPESLMWTARHELMASAW